MIKSRLIVGLALGICLGTSSGSRASADLAGPQRGTLFPPNLASAYGEWHFDYPMCLQGTPTDQFPGVANDHLDTKRANDVIIIETNALYMANSVDFSGTDDSDKEIFCLLEDDIAFLADGRMELRREISPMHPAAACKSGGFSQDGGYENAKKKALKWAKTIQHDREKAVLYAPVGIGKDGDRLNVFLCGPGGKFVQVYAKSGQ